MATYSNDQDVKNKLMDSDLPATISVEAFRSDAYSRINIELRRVYTVPVASADSVDMDYLKFMEAEYAAGLLLMNMAMPSEDRTLHAYGKSLVKGAQDKLMKILNQEVLLEGAAVAELKSNKESRPFKMTLNSPDGDSYFGHKMSDVNINSMLGTDNK